MDRFMTIATFLAALGAGLMGGFFFAFSNLVMPSLGRLPAPGGIAAMQTINVVVINPLFFVAFFGTALVALIVAIAAVFRLAEPGSIAILAGAALYLGGIILVTMLLNVPLNDALAASDPASGEGATLWADYLVRWTQWNHVRTVTGFAACGAFILALMAR